MYRIQMKLILFIILYAFARPSHSSTDMSLIGFYRTKPIAGGIQANAGYNQLIWGDPNNEKKLYGFVRPNLTIFSAGQYNSHAYEIEFWPISFIGVEFGSEKIINNAIYPNYDCDTFQCQSEFRNTYLKYNLLLGYSLFYFKGTYRKQTVEAYNNSKDFIYPLVGSALNRGEDKIETRELSFGFNFGYYNVIYQDINANIEIRKNKHSVKTIILSLDTSPFKTYINFGRFKSHQIDTHFIAAALTFNMGETLKLD